MWGVSSRGARLGANRRQGRFFRIGLVRAAVRGPVEHAVVELEGELDFTCSDALFETICAQPHRIVSIDLSSLEFVDGDGARMLMALASELGHRQGERPTLVGARRPVRRTFGLVDSHLATSGPLPSVPDPALAGSR